MKLWKKVKNLFRDDKCLHKIVGGLTIVLSFILCAFVIITVFFRPLSPTVGTDAQEIIGVITLLIAFLAVFLISYVILASEEYDNSKNCDLAQQCEEPDITLIIAKYGSDQTSEKNLKPKNECNSRSNISYHMVNFDGFGAEVWRKIDSFEAFTILRNKNLMEGHEYFLREATLWLQRIKALENQFDLGEPENLTDNQEKKAYDDILKILKKRYECAT